jgi:hypothetical protein
MIEFDQDYVIASPGRTPEGSKKIGPGHREPGFVGQFFRQGNEVPLQSRDHLRETIIRGFPGTSGRSGAFPLVPDRCVFGTRW